MAYDLNQLRNQLRINRHRLDEELELQPYVAEQISREVATLNSRQLEAKEELARVEARLYLNLRDGADKITANEIDAKVKRDRDRIQANGSYQALRHEYEVWLGMQDAWRQRGFAIKNLCELFCADYFAQTQTSVTTDIRAPRPGRDRVEAAINQHKEERTARRAASLMSQDDPPAARTRVRVPT